MPATREGHETRPGPVGLLIRVVLRVASGYTLTELITKWDIRTACALGAVMGPTRCRCDDVRHVVAKQTLTSVAPGPPIPMKILC